MKLHEKYNQIVQNVTMTNEEKNAMRSSLIWHIRSNKIPVKSHFYNVSWFKYGMAFAFLILVSGGGVSFASQSALPGDFSYPLKIQIEEIKGITKNTPKKKIVYSKLRAETRLKEMKTILANDTSGNEKIAEKIAIASKELESHVKDAKDNATIIANGTNETEQKEALVEVKNLEQNIEKDVKVLTALVDEKNKNSGQNNTDLADAITKNKDTVTEAVKDIALPKKAETDELDYAVSQVETSLLDSEDDAPAGTGEVRFNEQGEPILQVR